jgi:hypothetical protein
MSSQLGVQTGAQTPEGVSMVGLELELLGQLSIDRFDDLSHTADALCHRLRQLLVLVSSRHSHQTNTVAQKKSLCNALADIALVSHSIKVSVPVQKLIATLQISDVSRDEFKVQDHPSQRDEQLHLVAEEYLLFGGDAPKGGLMSSPLPGSLGSQVELHHRHRQSVYAALPLHSNIKHPQHYLSHQIESVPKPSSAPVEAALRRDVREQVSMALPLRKQRQLRVPAFALSHQTHRHQFLVRAVRSGAGTRKQVANLSVGVFHDAIHPQAQIVKARYAAALRSIWYHWVSSVFGSVLVLQPLPYQTGGFLVNRFYLA